MILEKIKELADKKGITVSTLEKQLDFGHGTIRGWEKCSPSVNNLKKVADYFDVTIEYFLK